MTFYEDMSPYSYWKRGDIFTDKTTGLRFLTFEPAYERLNIGWLSDDQPWASGPVPPAFVESLTAALDVQAVNELMGLHECEFCPPLDMSSYEPLPGHQRSSVGTGEIRIPFKPGSAFAAPTLIGHYVIDHGYRPPAPFIDAVLAFDPRGTSSARYPWVHFPWIPEDAVLDEVE
ncbi:hypothetical protein AB0I39_27410 [Kitasatospora purpeofusca]|uniref:DUF7919 family protein n=1 Tax=Kitasatospora purpeofusca TaxID=67352 RepID=UPI0033E2740A